MPRGGTVLPLDDNGSPSSLRARAKRMREHARYIDEFTAQKLRELADDYDAKAALIEAQRTEGDDR